ncbi:methionine aminopeptidase 1D, chloroplastic/mitochondrial-like [Hibiscus syriacus]|uniref:methionine aminopeptidase 1D, chloroplastic/mitochondrial-like n=1 Tax=Hibiscus syriacus TaxID=106335 RepID=UPI001921707F|nr:methionine aminopeptidase 1D, chloroplastic/mitochondrial-like [Hibiscus syriacus]
MVGDSYLQPIFLSSFVGDRLVQITHPLSQLFHYNPGPKHVSMQLSRSLSGLTNLLFNRRSNLDEVPNSKRKRLRPGKLSPCRPVPYHIKKSPYVKSRMAPGIASGPEVHDLKGIEHMRASGRLAAQVLSYAGTLVKPGITTDEIDEAVQMIINNGAYQSPLGYGGFPKSVCTSVNECICHGIPDSRPLEDGDIINIDVTVYLNQLLLFSGDTSATFFCGDVDEEARKLVKVTKECLDKAIAICAPGVEFKKIGKTIHDHADKFGYGVFRQFVGHGVGRVFFTDPVIQHFRSNDGGRMVLNQTFTIELMLTMGSVNPVMWDDDWTVVTQDGSLAAQFEHTILITEDEAEILTKFEARHRIRVSSLSELSSASGVLCLNQNFYTSHPKKKTPFRVLSSKLFIFAICSD